MSKLYITNIQIVYEELLMLLKQTVEGSQFTMFNMDSEFARQVFSSSRPNIDKEEVVVLQVMTPTGYADTKYNVVIEFIYKSKIGKKCTQNI